MTATSSMLNPFRLAAALCVLCFAAAAGVLACAGFVAAVALLALVRFSEWILGHPLRFVVWNAAAAGVLALMEKQGWLP